MVGVATVFERTALISICSEISSASSPAIARYRTVLSSQTRRPPWREPLHQAHADDQLPYIESLGDCRGERYASTGLAAESAPSIPVSKPWLLFKSELPAPSIDSSRLQVAPIGTGSCHNWWFTLAAQPKGVET